MGEVFDLPIKNYNEHRCLLYTYLHVARAHAGLNFMHKCIKARGVIADVQTGEDQIKFGRARVNPWKNSLQRDAK